MAVTEITTAEKPAATGTRYTEQEVRRALVEVAACSGNTHMAARNLAEDHMNLARHQTELAAAAATLISQRLPNMEDKDLVNAMGKADIGSGIHTEKAQLLSGQPTQRISRDSKEILRKLKGRGVVIDVEVVDEEDIGERDSASSGSGASAVAVVAPASE